jgi:solute carrier family 66, member 2
MIGMQILLLNVSLSNRPSVSSSYSHALQTPFSGLEKGKHPSSRPYNFWQWQSPRPYWSFLAYFTLTLATLEILIGTSTLYSQILGYTALAVEATLPLPQMAENYRKRSCKGFRFSVLANWLLGDVMKMVFFFNADGNVPWAFKLCGIFQFACDVCLGLQYWMYESGGDGRWEDRAGEKEKSDRL